MFLICNFWIFWSCHNCSFCFCRIAVETIFLMLLMNELNSSAWIESFHCMFCWIFDFYLSVKACFISADVCEWVLRNDGDESFELCLRNDVVCSELLKVYFLKFLMHTSTFIGHISEFLKALRIVDDLKVLLRILLKSRKNWCANKTFEIRQCSQAMQSGNAIRIQLNKWQNCDQYGIDF